MKLEDSIGKEVQVREHIDGADGQKCLEYKGRLEAVDGHMIAMTAIGLTSDGHRVTARLPRLVWFSTMSSNFDQIIVD